MKYNRIAHLAKVALAKCGVMELFLSVKPRLILKNLSY